MVREDIVPFLAEQIPADILCLGARTGTMSDTLNILERLERRYQERILQYLQLMTAVKVWKEEFVLRKVIGVQGYQNRSSRILF